MDDHEEVVTAREARQGPPGRPVLYVLVASLILGGLYMLSVLLWGEATDKQPPPGQQGSAVEQRIG